MTESRYDAVCATIDRANGEDPRRQEADGRAWPQEVLYSRRMVEWARKLAPRASEELLLAVRAQHLRRWTIPRSGYPEGRSGYLQWRERLKKFHADKVAEILKAAGYDEPSIGKVRNLILRKNLAADPEGQTLEDAACLVFLEFEFADFARKTEGVKVTDILRKTWEKMSTRARDLALKFSYGPQEEALLKKALGVRNLRTRLADHRT